MKKSAVREKILSQLRADLLLQTTAAHTARDEAISEESRPENQYDTHSQEAAYLAEGQARLAAEIAESITLYESLNLPDLPAASPVALGALVALDDRGRQSWFFIGPRGGGLELQVEGRNVLVLTPQSPLGRELMGKRVDDLVRLPNRVNGAPQRITLVV
ncbi:hypothetical protein [Opitutus terrae]|uniref:GreA/GreB family elongation factor n=1 Tax=Opitutus terrae (strain DSM 11246 / JCM 15787 / PB90-1) TaxID=452637 RepID=B1ZZ43_OPITP|nr:hypothetical protein [Opitutus terrae]ACB77115.1 conserved hypothetical protein [Opitutus terrae PB90-1]